MAPLSMGEKRRGNKARGTLKYGSPQSNRMVWNSLRFNMKFMLVVIITMGSPVIGEEQKTFELRIPQENKEECLKSAKTFKFSLPVISMDTRCEPKMTNEEPKIKGI